MNVSISLLVLLLTACMASAAPEQLAVWQFGNLITCYQPGVSPLKFNDYGCWCGLGGTGTPVDDLDQCCQVHDLCYRAARRAPGCTAIQDFPYVLTYHYTCTNKQVTCTATNNKCQAAVCECDRVAAQCFAEATYNPDNKNLDPKIHCVN